jgi:hypothetical protein
MTEEEQKTLQAEILATQRKEIGEHKTDKDEIEWLFSESHVPDILNRGAYRIVGKVGKWTVCVIERPKKVGVVTLLVILSLLLEAQNFYYAHAEHVDAIRYEISQSDTWGNINVPIINGFVIVPPAEEPAPHVPERDFVANPQPTFTIASLSGLSLPISGKYPHN